MNSRTSPLCLLRLLQDPYTTIHLQYPYLLHQEDVGKENGSPLKSFPTQLSHSLRHRLKVGQAIIRLPILRVFRHIIQQSLLVRR